MEEGESSQAQEPLMLPGAPRFSKKALCPPGHHSRVRACPLFVPVVSERGEQRGRHARSLEKSHFLEF